MGRVRFSIITSVHVWNDYRKNGLKRAIESVANQSFRDFEHIIVNDGSTEDFQVPDWPWLNVVNKQHEERVVGFNEGLKHAQGQILCFLDSDDEYDPDYLKTVNAYFKKYPKYKVFNFGCRFEHNDGKVSYRDSFKPKKLKVGHEVFGGGNVVQGTYVFHRSVYDDLGGFPPTMIENVDCSELNYGHVRNLYMWTPYDFSAAAQLEFPEIRQYFMIDHENEPQKIIKELGNPWGQDYYLFYKYTRKYHSKPFDDHLYIVHPKGGVE